MSTTAEILLRKRLQAEIATSMSLLRGMDLMAASMFCLLFDIGRLGVDAAVADLVAALEARE